MGHYAQFDLKLPGLGNAVSPRGEWSGVDQHALYGRVLLMVITSFSNERNKSAVDGI